MLWRWIRRLLFRLDAELAHELTVRFIRIGIGLGGIPLRIASGSPRPSLAPAADAPRVWDLIFRSRVGLAAGFDKNAEILTGLPHLGFGFAEIGTVTPRPQPGNDRPRLFRDSGRQAVFNRMGFNGLGAEIVSRRLERARADLPAGFPVGVNLGKNKDTPNESAAGDYQRAATAFQGLADYLVVNVSSPNTPGLRSLQSLAGLEPILKTVSDEIQGWKKRPPLLLKLAPEVLVQSSDTELDELMGTVEGWGVGGWVLTNTWGGTFKIGTEELSGGWSGGPLAEPARQALARARPRTRLPIVSVGGIMNEAEAMRRLSLGADLLQLYTGWIYGGPSLPQKIATRISARISRKNG